MKYWEDLSTSSQNMTTPDEIKYGDNGINGVIKGHVFKD
jgi:hypothetical protein